MFYIRARRQAIFRLVQFTDIENICISPNAVSKNVKTYTISNFQHSQHEHILVCTQAPLTVLV